MKNPKTSIIILNWNGWEDTIECINSIKKVSYPNYEIIVVDNASKGDDVNILRNKFLDSIRIIKNRENYGFAKGNNIAIKQVLKENKSKYILLLNNDTVVDKNFLTELVNFSEKGEKTAIVGPKMYYYSYNEKKNVIWFGGGKIDWKIYPGYHHIDQFKEDKEKNKVEKAKEVDWISGACLMINLKKINPLLKEDYYFGNEDIDKCLNVKKEGFDIIYVPRAIIWHKVGRSRKKIFMKNLNGDLTNFRLIKNNNRFWMFLLPYFSIVILGKFIIRRLKNNSHLK
ncbi:MAG TPA: glycosyltransferase family 2 protein [Candidatus Nanoarchaeia archaeon]|nr:glycosyltransferase family 2 protein [Candidatus Nanoarchaeia archaeon]